MTDRYAVIGNPISQSKSPLIHTAYARATGQDLEYTAIEGPLDGFAGAVQAFRAAGGRGMVGVHAAFTCSDDTLAAVSALPESDLNAMIALG